MELYRDADAPALDLGVERRLARLDRDLRVTWSRWAIDPMTSRPLVTSEGARIFSPEYHLWSRTGGRWYYVRSYPHFGHRQVMNLEADPARRFNADEILRRVRAQREALTERRERNLGERRTDITRANAKRIGDLVFEGKSGRRQAKSFGFAGQANRSTPGDLLRDAREDGWEMPEAPTP